MKLSFNIEYHTKWGESIYVLGNIPELGNDIECQAAKMTPSVNGMWNFNIEIRRNDPFIAYKYIVCDERGNTLRREWGTPHCIRADSHINEIDIFDHWHDIPNDKPFYSSAFTGCIFHRERKESVPTVKISPNTLHICISAPTIPSECSLAICGDSTELGHWDPDKALPMDDNEFPTWTADIPIKALGNITEYKFIIIRNTDRKIVAWENGENRKIKYDRAPIHNKSIVIAGLKFSNPMPAWRGAGVAIPVFSLRSDEDFGVGDFYDLRLLIDWAAKTGQKFIQLLPVNDTTMTGSKTDSYPYNANSTFALHPMYLRPQIMGVLHDKTEQTRFEIRAKELNRSDIVEYEEVNRLKREYTTALFFQQGHKELATQEFKRFFNRNAEWIKPYAVFSVLRDKNKTPDTTKWGKYSTYTPEKADEIISEYPEKINYIYYIQYHLDKQLRSMRDYAHSKGIAIKGDIPIGISRDSVDAWIYPQLFNLDCSAGAPPDDFAINGQNWGFPTYNWAKMSQDGFSWWKSRLRKMSEYFDAYRIDHVLGFFRIWQIPLNAIHGLLGTFNAALPYNPDELISEYDFKAEIERYTQPYITEEIINAIPSEYSDEIRHTYLKSNEYGQYDLLPEFSTQRQVESYFSQQPKNEKNDKIRNILMQFIDDVLFIKDPYRKEGYHLRIEAYKTHSYKSLTEHDRHSFDRLYHEFFYSRNDDFWKEKAMWKLPSLIDATDMLACAEDLGMIPACVPSVMNELKILSLEIERMPKNPGKRFGETWSYPYLSVCTTSTHDTSGIRAWWEESKENTQIYFNEMLHEKGDAPEQATPRICKKILSINLNTPSMLCILPIQDWLSIDETIRRDNPKEERINEPSNPHHYWCYRMHITLEQLLKSEVLNREIFNLISASGRQ